MNGANVVISPEKFGSCTVCSLILDLGAGATENDFFVSADFLILKYIESNNFRISSSALKASVSIRPMIVLWYLYSELKCSRGYVQPFLLTYSLQRLHCKMFVMMVMKQKKRQNKPLPHGHAKKN